jgi:GrpB-like predicted nucleotidyltransferase (UPF0157 family)
MIIGESPRHDGTITIAEYSTHWPELYEREAQRIRRTLGSGVRQLEHVGSTSVPGLAAKPLIDICLAVADPADESGYAPALESAGYVLRVREPDWHEHRLFKGPDTDVNLHVFAAGDAEIGRMVRFRDRLRTHSPDRELYERTKIELAARMWAYVQDYADAKSEVIATILEPSRGRSP